MNSPKFQNMTNAVALEATGNPIAALMLHYVASWHPRAHTLKWGERWSYFTREEWASRIGITVHQYSRWLPHLEKLNLVEGRKAFVNGKRVVCIRLLPRAIGLLPGEKKAPDLVPSTANSLAGSTPHIANSLGGQFAKVPTTHIQLSTKNSNQPSQFAPGQAVSGHTASGKEGKKKSGEGEVIKISEEQKTPLKQVPKSVSEILAKHKNQSVTSSPPLTPKDAWVKAMVTAYPDQLVPSLTIKQQGQLKQVLNKLPREIGLDVIAWAVANWTAFVGEVEKKAGAFNTPDEPTVWFFVKHFILAGNGYLEQKKSEELNAQMKAKMKLSALVANPVPGPAHYVPTPVDPDDKPIESMEQLIALMESGV